MLKIILKRREILEITQQSRGHGFHSQHPHESSQPSVISRDLASSSDFGGHQVCVGKKTDIKKRKI